MKPTQLARGVICTLFVLTSPLAAPAAIDPPRAEPVARKVSYYKDVRPIFQARCQGCHQPAKARGRFVMTDFAKLLAGGESGLAAVVPGKPDDSNLVDVITPTNGEALMPKDQVALAQTEIELIARWIGEGAVDDTPQNARARFDPDHPPVYTQPPVITDLDYSPDGSLLSVSGFHEVLLVNAQTGALEGRLVGLSERIQSVRFSPDGARLAVAGGLPARMGEVQIWDVAKRKLTLSVPVTFDTLYGVSWSPDGSRVAVGCADNSVRAIDANSGEQVLFMGSHTDWVLGTVFSVDGSNVASIGRDMTAKLTETATQRFVDNITSITPGALKGGIQSIARHPTRDEIVLGGSDGVVKVYRMRRASIRVIGDDGNLIREMPAVKGRLFSVAVSRDGKRIAAGSSLDGTGEMHVYSYEFDTGLPDNIKAINEKVVTSRSAKENADLEAYHRAGVTQIAQTNLTSAVYAVAFRPDGQVVATAGADGMIRLIDAASGSIVREFAPAPIAAAVASQAAGAVTQTAAVDFIRDVGPVLSRLGCNQGTCHGSAKGKNGFKLSLRGYDPLFDVRALTDDIASRRVNVASPDDSLMLLKTTAAVPHEGGQIFKPGDPYYQMIRHWISGGAKLNIASPRVTEINIAPRDAVLERIGEKQQYRVVAIYSDGATREVTREAFIESGNAEVAAAARGGELTAVRRGEAPVLARYEGSYAATTLTVMGDRTGFLWQQPPTWGRLDDLVAAKWQRMQILPSELCSDAEFIRRVTLDLTGLPPTAEQVGAFVGDARDTRVKRDELIDRLIGCDDFIEYWTNKWADLLQVNRKFLGVEGAAALRKWIRDEIAKNTPHDQFVHKIITSVGSNRENPAAAYFKVLRAPDSIMENTTHLFMAVRFNCNKCHDHPFERWTQDQYYQTAAYFARVDLKADPASGDKQVGGTAVEGAKPLYEIVAENNSGEVTHARTGELAQPKFPFELGNADPIGAAAPSRRDSFANWLVDRKNPYFARSFVNRLWGYLFGIGIMEPIDDIRAGNPPTNPELLRYLTDEFIQSGFDSRHVLRLICKSRTYQLSVDSHRWNADDHINYSHARARRLPAEVLLDSVYRVTGSQSKFPEVAPGTRAAALPDSGIELPSGFLTTFGRPARESACECERSSGLQLGPVMALISGPTIADAIADPNNALAKLAANEKDDRKLVDEVFLRILNRPARDPEVKAVIDAMQAIDADHTRLTAALTEREAFWAKRKPELEREREAVIAKTKQEINDYEKRIEPQVQAQEKQRVENIAKAEANLKQFEDALPLRVAEWEKANNTSVDWMPLEPGALAASNGAKLTRLPDRSIRAEGNSEKASYTITTQTNLRAITGVRLEVLPVDGIPGGGPGLAQNGNFVLTQFILKAGPKSDAKKFAAVALQNAKADFTQATFDIAQTIDGTGRDQQGWAVNPAEGTVHWATFETKQPIDFEGGAALQFVLNQFHNAPNHRLARFRISVTTDKLPLGLSLPEDLKAIVATVPDQRGESQKRFVADYVRKIDPMFQTRQTELAEAKKPVPVDPGLQNLRTTLEYVSRPVPDDVRLTQLRRDLEQSTQQLGNKRLTTTQDLAWALINSPSFLFNR